MFNLFDTGTNDINYLLESAGINVSINNNSTKAIITNTPLNKFYDGKKITTLTEIKRGDIVNYENSKFIIISESATKRNNKYKALMRKCESEIYFKVDEIKTPTGEVDYLGQPIYNTTEIHELFPVIVDSQTFDIQNGQAINMPVGTILVSFQDNANTNFIKLDHRFIKYGKAWKIVGIDKTKKGLVTLTAEIGLTSSYDDLENEIAYDYQQVT
ncbi:hypothetical protein [Schinkia azotoformans]|uniref:hypothetical protein n=1 Tax=Schinkia azotoformans TaxID=1454 RepID=UPI002DBB565E|nr:hypothetical protein [Schinkia azotoformans]MEC1715936.1 hypothetical protein [Schinkia azotoformans]MEC1740111.1 hypothetical protein [Schinkia azotoformans]MEC1744569.1 hypothetical protein [Schinkia azotoformans]MEC1756277.1 hypothetical protein [Schinkia azotoformans]MEC1769150.1 hypothetical protein [Schinkia azotoformans]